MQEVSSAPLDADPPVPVEDSSRPAEAAVAAPSFFVSSPPTLFEFCKFSLRVGGSTPTEKFRIGLTI